MKLVNGKVLKGGGIGDSSLWIQTTAATSRLYTETPESRTLAHDQFLVCSDYTGEPHPWEANRPVSRSTPATLIARSRLSGLFA